MKSYAPPFDVAMIGVARRAVQRHEGLGFHERDQHILGGCVGDYIQVERQTAVAVGRERDSADDGDAEVPVHEEGLDVVKFVGKIHRGIVTRRWPAQEA
jgi:hypothetical protein